MLQPADPSYFYTRYPLQLLHQKDGIMKYSATIVLLLFLSCCSFAQKDSLDLVVYSPLKNWQKNDQKNVRTYSFIDRRDKSWCQVAIYQSTASKGSIEADFDSEWNELAATPFHVDGAPEKSSIEEADGWKIQAGSGKFIFNDSVAVVLMTTFSGYNRCVSIVATTSHQRYLQDIIDFVGGIEVKKPLLSAGNSITNPYGQAQSVSGKKDGYAFNTTNFDDGWVSVIKEDWVEVTRGDVKVLLHFPKEGTIFPADPAPMTNAAWNILVAPRYSNIKNYKTASISTYNRPYLGMGTLTENSSGKEVFVLIFQQDAGWIEFVMPDKNAFISMFRFDPETVAWDTNSDLVKPLSAMKGYNRFAVAATDIAGTGKWNDHFASNTYYTNIYTGMSAGMSTYSSSQWFEFGKGNTYRWQLVATNSYGGATSFAQAKGAGTFKSLNNWQLYFSDIEGKPKTYDVYFTATKAGRVLWMNDAQYKGSGIFTGYSKE